MGNSIQIRAVQAPPLTAPTVRLGGCGDESWRRHGEVKSQAREATPAKETRNTLAEKLQTPVALIRPAEFSALIRIACGLANHLPPLQTQSLIEFKLAARNMGGRLTVTELGRRYLVAQSKTSCLAKGTTPPLSGNALGKAAVCAAHRDT